MEIENKRKMVKGDNMMTDIKNSKKNVSVAYADVQKLKDMIEDYRRINMHYQRSNNSFLNRSVDTKVNKED